MLGISQIVTDGVNISIVNQETEISFQILDDVIEELIGVVIFEYVVVIHFISAVCPGVVLVFPFLWNIQSVLNFVTIQIRPDSILVPTEVRELIVV